MKTRAERWFHVNINLEKISCKYKDSINNAAAKLGTPSEVDDSRNEKKKMFLFVKISNMYYLVQIDVLSLKWVNGTKVTSKVFLSRGLLQKYGRALFFIDLCQTAFKG